MKKLAPHVVDLAQDACLCAFWRKSALAKFLRQHRISDSHLTKLNSADVSKRDYLGVLFYDLISKGDGSGHIVILSIAQSLAGMVHFPDLENWEDSPNKIEKARVSVSRLKVEVSKIDVFESEERLKQERRKADEERRLRIIAEQQSLASLKSSLVEIAKMKGTQGGGYAFEKWFYELASFSEVDSRPSYKADGRQIDGSLTVDGTTYLVETKYTNTQTGSQDIDVFMSKVAAKADNTMGVFVSMSGFNPNAIKTASRERTTIILFDYSHMYNLVLAEVMSLSDVIRRVRRHASQTGQAYLAVSDFSG